MSNLPKPPTRTRKMGKTSTKRCLFKLIGSKIQQLTKEQSPMTKRRVSVRMSLIQIVEGQMAEIWQDCAVCHTSMKFC